MPGERAKAYASAEEAAAALSGFAKAFVLPRDGRTAQDLARLSADSPWMKALSRKRAGGVDFYARWAAENVPKMAKSARFVSNQGQFDLLVRRTGMDLLRSWRGGPTERRARLSYGAAFRAVDLLFMAINESEPCRSGQVQAFLHAPLDGYTLRPLRLCIDELLDGEYAIEIPAVVPSGFVATEEQYVLLQAAIHALADRAGATPVAYAYLCDSRP